MTSAQLTSFITFLKANPNYFELQRETKQTNHRASTGRGEDKNQLAAIVVNSLAAIALSMLSRNSIFFHIIAKNYSTSVKEKLPGCLFGVFAVSGR